MNKIMICLPVIIFLFFLSCVKDPTGIRQINFHWKSAAPGTQQMNAGRLAQAQAEAQASGYIDGLLVIRNGFIVSENYFNGYNAFRPHNIKSVSKSFLSAITGIALQQGYIASLEEKMLDYFPEYIYPGMAPEKYEITIRHLLTMQMGIRGESEDNFQVYQNLYNSGNWIKSTIEAPLVYRPGEKMRYNTFQTHLLSAIISKATHMSTRDFARQQLFEPMSIDIDDWERGPQGYHFGGNGMYFTPREMAMLGYIYLNDGKLQDQQIVPAQWVRLTLSASSNLTHPNAWGELKNYNYGYLWWLGEIGGNEIFMGLGYGGQYVIVFPELDLIVVTTARGETDPDTANNQEQEILEIIADYILPADEK